MRREIIINADPGETRIAILEDGQLVELLVERPEERRFVGDIYKGRVNAVLPGMQAAFLELGLPKTAFLHVSDLAETLSDEEALEELEGGRNGRHRRRRHTQNLKIEDFLKKGQDLVVQVTKEPIGTKGPRVTGQISLPGRYLVFMPGVNHVGVSRRIESRDERTRLKTVLNEVKPKNAGLIVRTAGEEKGKKEFASDVRFLSKIWAKIEKKAEESPSPALLHREMELTTGLIRDLFTEDVDELVIDAKDEHRDILTYLKLIAPELVPRVKLYRGALPIFDHYKIEQEIEKLLDRKVWLKKGGYITIDFTEALVAIDVNTGRYTGKKNQEDTIYKTNLEAAKEIARQLRLRDIGGIIVLDFIDMEIEANKKSVLDTLRSALKHDRARTKTFAVSDLGLVEMTRQRERPSLLHYFSDDCPACYGLGKVLSLESLAIKVERILRRVGIHSKERNVELRVHPQLAVHIFEQYGKRLEQLERLYRYKIDVRDDPRIIRDEIRVIFPRTGEDVTEKFTA